MSYGNDYDDTPQVMTKAHFSL